MLRAKQNKSRETRRVTYHTPRDSGQETEDDAQNHSEPALQRHLRTKSLDNRQGDRLDIPTASKCEAAVKPFFPAAFATNPTMNTSEILEETLSMIRSARYVLLNTQLLESIPEGDTAFMSRLMEMGANPNATCRLSHVSACHIAALYDNDALDLLLESGADLQEGGSKSDKQGRTPLHLAAWAGNAKQIALLLNFPEALRKSVVGQGILSPETVEEVKRHSQPVNDLTNIPCRINLMSTLPDEWSDGVEHNCRHITEILPQFQEGWTPLHAASARAQHHCVQLLLAAGADANALDLLCRTPLDVAGYAHYMGHKIDVNNFEETVKTLLNASGNFQKVCHKTNLLDTLLHTAIELESKAAVEQMLQGGASATSWNSQGLTAMHVCIKNRNKELLQLLANHACRTDDPFLATVDVKDQSGSTALCAAVKTEWMQGVCIALGAGANITITANGESPIHIAAELGNIDILQAILSFAKYNNMIDFRNEKGETALFKAICCNQLDAVKLLLEAGSSIEVEIADKANVFHVAAKHGRRDVLKHLLEYNSNVTAKLINRSTRMGPPLYYAVLNNHLNCAELLISKGAQVNVFLDFMNEHIFTRTSLLHVAAIMNHYKIAEIIIKRDSETIHVANSVGRTPLHEACYKGNREMIALLLRNGADLSEAETKGISETNLTSVDILMNNLSKPTEFMEEIFDSYISSSGVTRQEYIYEVAVDLGVLIPNKSNWKEMGVINALINSGNRYHQQRLLFHPLVQSFLYRKWALSLPFLCSILVVHMWFVLSLYVYAISLFYFEDKNQERPVFFNSNIWICSLIFSICLIAIQEITFIKIKSKRYLLCTETLAKFGSITLALFLPLVVSLDFESSDEYVRLIATVAVLLSCFEMMFLLSKFPNWGYYVLMFGKVASKVFKVLVSFVILIFGFSVSFMIQFRSNQPFEGPLYAFITTMVMMTSEYDYNDTLSKESAAKASASIMILRLIFLSFLILFSIVLMNLLVAVAVNDVNNLEIIGVMKRLENQVEFLSSLEVIASYKFTKKILPECLYKRLVKKIKYQHVMVLATTYTNCNCRLPAGLRKAIFEKAQLQKKQSDDEQGRMLYQMKQEKMYKVVVQREPAKSGDLVNALNKIIEDNNKLIQDNNEIRNDINMIKNFTKTTKRRSINSTSIYI